MKQQVFSVERIMWLQKQSISFFENPNDYKIWSWILFEALDKQSKVIKLSKTGLGKHLNMSKNTAYKCFGNLVYRGVISYGPEHNTYILHDDVVEYHINKKISNSHNKNNMCSQSPNIYGDMDLDLVADLVAERLCIKMREANHKPMSSKF